MRWKEDSEGKRREWSIDGLGNGEMSIKLASIAEITAFSRHLNVWVVKFYIELQVAMPFEGCLSKSNI